MVDFIKHYLTVKSWQVYDDDSDEKRSTNMNMGPRTWYQVPPRELRYPEVNPALSLIKYSFEDHPLSKDDIIFSNISVTNSEDLPPGPAPAVWPATNGPGSRNETICRRRRPRYDGAAQLRWGLQWTEATDPLTSPWPVRGPWWVSKRSKRTELKLKLSKFPRSYPPGAGRGKSNGPPTPHNGKKTKGRVRKKLFFGLQLTLAL